MRLRLCFLPAPDLYSVSISINASTQDRTTVLVDAPFIGICGAVHMEELMRALGEADPLGLRERLLVMYEHPRVTRSAELREACARIPGPTLHGYLAESFWSLHRVHTPAHKLSQFTMDLNYPWLFYSWSPEAAATFWENFDACAGDQEENYGLDQQAAKRAGKRKTRHFRLALPMHNLQQKACGTEPERWNLHISSAAARASLLFSDYIDKVFERLDILRQKDALPPAPAAAKATARGSAAEVKALLDMNSVADVSAGVNVQHLFTAASAVCVSQKSPCLRASDIHHMRPVRTLELSVEQVQLLGRRALQLLCLLGLGTTGISTNTSGTKCLWFVKRPTEHLQSEVLQGCFDCLATHSRAVPQRDGRADPNFAESASARHQVGGSCSSTNQTGYRRSRRECRGMGACGAGCPG